MKGAISARLPLCLLAYFAGIAADLLTRVVSRPTKAHSYGHLHDKASWDRRRKRTRQQDTEARALPDPPHTATHHLSTRA